MSFLSEKNGNFVVSTSEVFSFFNIRLTLMEKYIKDFKNYKANGLKSLLMINFLSEHYTNPGPC